MCDVCGEETRCFDNPYDSWHCDDDCNHTCDYCGVWLSSYCFDDDCDGYCDEYECGREYICAHEGDHTCYYCGMPITPCYDYDFDGWCDECYAECACTHEGMDGHHICRYCYELLTPCDDADGDGMCDMCAIGPQMAIDSWAYAPMNRIITPHVVRRK